MAKFILQNDEMELEEFIIKKLLIKNKYLHTYSSMSLRELKESTDLQDGYIPIGTIEFVSTYLSKVYNISVEIPIEIPKYLQTEEFLKRYYRIVEWTEIPRTGTFFLKDISVLKEFSGIMNATFTDIDELFNYIPKGKFDASLILNKNHLFQVSSLLNIKSEYRVYVITGEIEAISNYNGDATLLPDIELLNKAVMLIQAHEKYLKSYTIDLAVGDFGTAILEIHNFTSVGLYHNLWGDSLLYAYKDGIDYLINDNSIKYK
ncbi:MAG: ATP-grasp domain-containing protein [Bacilli bacterium]|nr:ATP-grasp domain-containing protein [Bacilli bacterium]MBQ8218828.1 ATP-grasp domain-containing protein [Bacilli bacterium]